MPATYGVSIFSYVMYNRIMYVAVEAVDSLPFPINIVMGRGDILCHYRELRTIIIYNTNKVSCVGKAS